MKRILKMQLAVLMALFVVVGLSVNVEAAAKKPYEYELKVDEDDETGLYNGFKGAKQMVITFDKDKAITATVDEVKNNLSVQQGEKTEPINIIGDVSIDTTENIVTIKFKNLEFIDYSEAMDFKLVIDKDAKLYFDQLTAYEFPFEFHDLLPGFESTFIKSNMDGTNNLINTNIFKHNEPREVMIHIPPIYMTKIETIHRYKGLVDPGKSAPNLSNIDVTAHPDATRLKVKFKGGDYTDQYGRDLDRSTSFGNGFSMGQAGIDELTCTPSAGAKPGDSNDKNCKSKDSDEFELRAYDQFGRILSDKKFKMKVLDRVNDFKVSDYINAPDKIFGTNVSLYDLMSNPALLNKVIESTEVSELDKFGVTYSLGSSIEVKDLPQLEMALANDNFKTIKLTQSISINSLPNDTLFINRNVTISGGKIQGNVILGDGTEDLTVRLDGVDIEGDLTINVGAEGTTILENVSVNGAASETKIISGGSNSVHLNNFKSENGIELQNKTSLRLVILNKTDETDKLNIIYSAGAPVNIELIDGKVGFELGKDEIAENIEITEENKIGIVGLKENIVIVDEFKDKLESNKHFKITPPSNRDEDILNSELWQEISKKDALIEFGEVELALSINEQVGEVGEVGYVKISKSNWAIEKSKTTNQNWNVQYSKEGQTLRILNATLGDEGTVILEAKNGDQDYHIKVNVTVSGSKE